MNINKIFGTFESVKQPKEKTFDDMKDHPYVISGLIFKSINGMNDYIFNAYVVKGGLKTQTSSQYNEYYLSAKNILLNNCYENLIKLNIEEPECIKHVLRHPYNNFKNSIIIMLKHFETIEDYEKCSVIKKFLEKLNLSFIKSLAS